MAKRKRSERRRAAQEHTAHTGQSPTLASTPTTPTTVTESATTLPAPATPAIRDAVTGEAVPLDVLRHGLVMRVQTRDVRVDRHPIHSEEVTGVSSVPTRLHTRKQDGAIGKAYAAQFLAYMQNVRPQSVVDAERERVFWWRGEYAQARLRRGFHARYGAKRGEEALSAALAMLERPDQCRALADYYCHTVTWVARQRDFACEVAFKRD